MRRCGRWPVKGDAVRVLKRGTRVNGMNEGEAKQLLEKRIKYLGRGVTGVTRQVGEGGGDSRAHRARERASAGRGSSNGLEGARALWRGFLVGARRRGGDKRKYFEVPWRELRRRFASAGTRVGGCMALVPGSVAIGGPRGPGGGLGGRRSLAGLWETGHRFVPIPFQCTFDACAAATRSGAFWGMEADLWKPIRGYSQSGTGECLRACPCADLGERRFIRGSAVIQIGVFCNEYP